MISRKQIKLHMAQKAFERAHAFIRHELPQCNRTDHLEPVLDFLEWLVGDMAELAGATLEVKDYAKRFAAMRTAVATHKPPKPQPRTASRPKLRLVK